MGPQWLNDYPQPENDYEELTYELSKHCSKCGIGKNQVNSFRLKREPKWGRRSFFQVNWVFDELFVKKEIWEKLFKPYNIDYRVVLNKSGQRELQDVVQLKLEEVVSLDTQEIEYDTCPSCKRKKYRHIMNNFYPPLTQQPNKPIFKTKEYFGSGGAANQLIIIDSNFYGQLLDLNIKGLEFHPLKNTA